MLFNGVRNGVRNGGLIRATVIPGGTSISESKVLVLECSFINLTKFGQHTFIYNHILSILALVILSLLMK